MQGMVEEQKAALSQAIRDRREEIHLSQEDLARRLDVSVQTVGRWERNEGKKAAAFSRLEEIAAALDTTSSDLSSRALLIRCEPVDRSVDEDDLRDLLLSMRGQLADLQAKVARVETLQEALNKTLKRESPSPEDNGSP